MQSLVEGLSLSLYEFNKYKGNGENKPSFLICADIDIISEDNHVELEQIVKKTSIIADVGLLCARPCKLPAQCANPAHLATSATSIEDTNKVKVKILINIRWRIWD